MAQEPQMRSKHGTHKNLTLSRAHSRIQHQQKRWTNFRCNREKNLQTIANEQEKNPCRMLEIVWSSAKTMHWPNNTDSSVLVFFSLCIVWLVSNIHVRMMLLQSIANFVLFPRYHESQQPFLVWVSCACVLWNIYSNIPNVLIGKPHHNPKSSAYARECKRAYFVHNENTTPPHHSKNANWKISTSSIQHPHTHTHAHIFTMPVSISFPCSFSFYPLLSSLSLISNYLLADLPFIFRLLGKKSLFCVSFFSSSSSSHFCLVMFISFLFSGYFISMLCSHPLLAFYLHNPRIKKKNDEKQRIKYPFANSFNFYRILTHTHINTMQSVLYTERKGIGMKPGWKIRNQKRHREQKKTYCYHVVTYLCVSISCVSVCVCR